MQKQDLDILDAYNIMEDVIKVFNFLFFYFFLQSINKWVFATNSNTQTFLTWWCMPLIFHIQNIWSNKIHSFKYLRSPTFGSKDIVIRKSEFVAKTQFLYLCKDTMIQGYKSKVWLGMLTFSFFRKTIVSLWKRRQKIENKIRRFFNDR